MLFRTKYMDMCEDILKAEKLSKKTGVSKRTILRDLEKERQKEKRKKTARYIAAGII